VLDREGLYRLFDAFCEKNEFELNPDRSHVDAVLDGVLTNEKRYGVKFCPCRIVTGDFNKDVELLCPCNFTFQEKYKTQAECWCGLFKKKLK